MDSIPPAMALALMVFCERGDYVFYFPSVLYCFAFEPQMVSEGVLAKKNLGAFYFVPSRNFLFHPQGREAG